MDGNPIENSEDQAPVLALKDDSIANELVRARKVKGWTQNELHNQSGISRDVIKAYETGRNKPGAREIRILCDVLRISPNRLLLGTDEFDLPASPLRGIMEDAQANEATKTLKLMTMFGMLTDEERKALYTLIEPILLSRKDGERKLRAVFAGIDALASHLAPEITGFSETLGKKITRKKAVEISKEIRERAKQAK